MDFDHDFVFANDLNAQASSTQEQLHELPTWDPPGGNLLRQMEQHIDQLIAAQNQNLASEAYRRRSFQESLYYDQNQIRPQQSDAELPETMDPRMTMIMQDGFEKPAKSLPEHYMPDAELYAPHAPPEVINERIDSPVDPVDARMFTHNSFDDIFAGALPDAYTPNAAFSETYAPVAVMERRVDSPVEPGDVRPEQQTPSDITILRQEHDPQVTFARTGQSRSTASNGELPALPQSIFTHGFTPEDFNPSTKYESEKPSKGKFKPFPDDLPETYIFKANPSQIAYDNILRVATRYTNAQIQERINEGRPEEAIKSSQVIDSRIKTALAWRAEKENVEGGKSMQIWSKLRAWQISEGDNKLHLASVVRHG